MCQSGFSNVQKKHGFMAFGKEEERGEVLAE